MPPETSDDIDTQAAAWAAAVDRAELPENQQAQLEAWLGQDRRHLGAYARARAVLARYDRGRALGTSFDFLEFHGDRAPIRLSPFRWAAAAMVVGLMLAAGIMVWRGYSGAITTARGEVRIVPLMDGSAVTLNTESKLAVEYSKTKRDVQLLAGEALFNVAKDHSRPFVVHAGHTIVRAVGTSFSVRRYSDDTVKVLVREGVVEVTQGEGADFAPIRVSAASELVAQLQAPTPVRAVPAIEVDRELAWQQGMISLDGRTLREAAEEFARYSSTRIVIDDPDLAERTVTGLFANNPVGFAHAAAGSMGLTVTVEGNTIRLAR